MAWVVWERPAGGKYEQPIAFDLTRETAESIVSMCPAGYTRTAEVSPPEINTWLEFSR